MAFDPNNYDIFDDDQNTAQNYEDVVKDLKGGNSTTLTDGSDASSLHMHDSDYLAKDNISIFNPTADYHPATKKYVDDNAGGGAVDSVFGRTGAVVAQSGDYDASEVTNAFDKINDDSDNIIEGITKLLMTVSERSNLATLVNTLNNSLHFHNSDRDMDNAIESATKKVMTSTERSNLADAFLKTSDTSDNIIEGAVKLLLTTTERANLVTLVNTLSNALHYHDSDRARGNHTGTQSADTITDGTTNKAYTTTEQSKLAGIEENAEVNNISDINAVDLTDGGDSTLHFHATDRDRSNHTGLQTASTISDFDTEVANNSAVTANTAKVSYTDAATVAANTADIADMNDVELITAVADVFTVDFDSQKFVNKIGITATGNAITVNLSNEPTTTLTQAQFAVVFTTFNAITHPTGYTYADGTGPTISAGETVWFSYEHINVSGFESKKIYWQKVVTV